MEKSIKKDLKAFAFKSFSLSKNLAGGEVLLV